MTGGEIVALGAIAGGTIVLGLPVARSRGLSSGTRSLLNAVAIGILLFLFWDILSHAVEPVEDALMAAHAGEASWLRFGWLAAVLTVGVTAGLVPLGYYDRWMAGRRTRFGPGAMAVDEPTAAAGLLANPTFRLALLIAIGIGLHNFSEGLAIGQSAAGGEIGLAVLLVIGFALHNATEGFGITAPFAAAQVRPSWAVLGLLGLIGGGPTFLGTLIGQSFSNDAVSILFLALAAGSILFVVIELVGVALRMGAKHVLYWGLMIGLVAGFATDFLITVAGV
ncbi:MAG TPA: ZIP family metal transporter [Jatrophihabitans sp.]|nr:ZIP family metal transporter [Jatrophihabitans sp.]